jgi:hypothetical protein
MSTLKSLFLYFGLLSDIVCHPGLEVHIGTVIPDALQFCTWNVIEFYFNIPNFSEIFHMYALKYNFTVLPDSYAIVQITSLSLCHYGDFS